MKASNQRNQSLIKKNDDLKTTSKLFHGIFSPFAFWLLFLSIAVNSGCKKSSDNNNTTTTTGYQEVKLVADTAIGAARIDSNLNNAWGIAIGPTGYLWIASNHKNVSTVYDRNGATALAPVTVDGDPTGVIYNSTSDFGANKFIFAGEGGKVLAWSSGMSATTVADRSLLSAVYKGIAMASDPSDGNKNFIYLANFKGNRVDVFDKDFNLVLTKLFLDPTIPAGFAPFNIQNIDGKLYIAYAKQLGPDNEDDEKGAGNGYINIFNPNGTLVKRFASTGTLNSPWAITKAPDGFGLGSNMLLVGNFGDGRINVFDSSGVFQGQLKDGTNPISIDGLWALSFPVNGQPTGDQNQLFYTAGPYGEEHGLFGYIKKR
ncbi:MAG: hypothetical protein JWN78_3055 [Bacteroidota bacterium]|nr:hypothetical protein [Bacteroidota bacterium]